MDKQIYKLPKGSSQMIDRTFLNFEDCLYEVVKINDSEFRSDRYIEIRLIKWESRVINNNCSKLWNEPHASHNRLVENLVEWIDNEFKGHLFIYDEEEDDNSLFGKLYLKHSTQIQNIVNTLEQIKSLIVSDLYSLDEEIEEEMLNEGDLDSNQEVREYHIDRAISLLKSQIDTPKKESK